jgi:hypothetical protein
MMKLNIIPLTVLLLFTFQLSAQTLTTTEQAQEEAAYTLGVQAYLWGYPMYHNELTFQAGTKVGGIYINSYRKFNRLKDASDRFVVTPNNVSIDGYAMFDVTKEPLVVHVPKLTEERWYLLQLGDFFDEVIANLGGIKPPVPGDYVITGPSYNGELPGEMTQIKTRTNYGIVALRIYAKNKEDINNAVDLQKGFRIIPLSKFLRHGLAYEAPASSVLPAFENEAPPELHFFENLGRSMQDILPIATDQNNPLVASFQQIGLSVANGFEWENLSDPVKRGLIRASKSADQIIENRWLDIGESTNGWSYVMAGGRAGHDFVLRATMAKKMVGAQLSEQVIYPNTKVDADGSALNGKNNYILHFENGQLPPVTVFWNLSMYASDMLFIENDFKRYSIGSTTDGLKTNEDGSLTIYMQNERPSVDKVSNWLPAPKDGFNLTMRLYGPSTPLLDGTYRLPAVQKSK